MTSALPINTRTMPRKGSCTICAQDLLALLGSKAKSGFLRQKRLSSIMKSVKWRLQFVILAHNAIYVYENEMSKAPAMSIPLLGYIAVERETTSTCAWVFALVPKVKSLPRRSFACSKDDERLEWMQEVKRHLYTANNINDVPQSSKFKDKMKMAENLTPEEQMYVELEFPIIPPEEQEFDDTKSLDGCVDDDDDDSSADESDEEDTLGVSGKSFGSEARVKVRGPSVKKPQGQTQGHTQGQGQTTSYEALDTPDGIVPPRYSAIVGGKELEYENLGAVSNMAKVLGLERACTITDENTSKDRSACIEMLKKTKKIGTYLIRRSRTQDYKVLAILADEDAVKEFRIEEAYGLFHFFHDTSHEFPTIESLLAYYSHHKPVPSLGAFLQWGVHECADGGAETYEETS